MFSAEGQQFKSLQDARDYCKYDLEYGEHEIRTIDGHLHETVKGSKTLLPIEDILNQPFKTPLIFCNEFPETPTTLTIGELTKTQPKDGQSVGDARRLKIQVHTPFVRYNKQKGAEETIQFDASVYCKDNDDAMNQLLGAFGAIGKNLGDVVTVTRSGETFTATEGGDTSQAPQGAQQRQTTAAAIQTAQAPPAYVQAKHTTQDIGQKFAQCYGLAKWAIVDVNEMSNATPADIGAAAACIFIADTRTGTVINDTVKEEAPANPAPQVDEDGIPF